LVSRHQKGKPFWILLEQEMIGWQWHQLDYIQIICTTLQTDNHASTSPLNFFTGRMPFLLPNQQHQSTEGKVDKINQQISPSIFTNHALLWVQIKQLVTQPAARLIHRHRDGLTEPGGAEPEAAGPGRRGRRRRRAGLFQAVTDRKQGSGGN